MNIELLTAVISTLNTIHVRGKDDLDAMLGCISALERCVVLEQERAHTQEVDHG